MLSIVDHKKLLKRTDILVKLIDHVQHCSQLFKIGQYFTDFTEELELFKDKITNFEKEVLETVKSQTARQYPYLMEKSKEIKSCIDDSMMYRNY